MMRYRGKLRIAAWVALGTWLLLGRAVADYVTLDENERFGEKRWGVIPYVFSTEALKGGGGLALLGSGFLQPQTGFAATAFYTANDSWLFAAFVRNLRVPGLDRLFIDLYAQGSHFTDQRFYEGVDPETGIRFGSNDSNKEQFVSGVSDDLHLELTMRYALPVGAGREAPLTRFRTRRGMRISEPRGGKVWNPLTSGKTIAAARLFYRYRDLERLTREEATANTNGIELWLDYDNTDFLPNPSFGSRQKLKLTMDFGWFDSANSWTNIDFDASKYFDLGTSQWFRQQVLALDFWTSYTPTWDLDERTGEVRHGPPPGFGSTLGGYDRLRGFPVGRFIDKAAVYYTGEIRLTPHYNGLDTIPVIQWFDIDWWQVVGFVEAGRVGPEYGGELFFEDLKWDVGLSLRLMAFRQPVRLDWAYSEEGSSIWAMVSQPFSR